MEPRSSTRGVAGYAGAGVLLLVALLYIYLRRAQGVLPEEVPNLVVGATFIGGSGLLVLMGTVLRHLRVGQLFMAFAVTGCAALGILGMFSIGALLMLGALLGGIQLAGSLGATPENSILVQLAAASALAWVALILWLTLT